MISVSNGWIAAHKETLLPETFIEITCAVTESGVQEAAIPSSTNEMAFSNVVQTTNGLTKFSEEYATLEQGVWGLDGTSEYFDGSPVSPGYVSAVLSDADCSFTTIPTITLTFPTQRQASIPGMSITWSTTYNEWATDFRVSVWNDDTRVAQTTVTGNSTTVSDVPLNMEYYNRITIEILKWSLPYHRARCINITLGRSVVYTKDDLISYTHRQSADLLSAALPTNEITFVLRNDDSRWNPDNPTGVERYLLEQQEIRVRYGMTVDGNTQWIKGGTFWLSEWNTPANGIEASFTAKSAFDIMNEVYTGITKGNLYDIANAAIIQADLGVQENGVTRYALSETLKDFVTDFNNEGYTIAEVLQMVAHAGNCVLFQDRDGVVHIEPWSKTYAGYIISPDVSYSYPEYEICKPLRAVSVAYGDDKRAVVYAAERGEVQTIDNPLIVSEAHAQTVANKAIEILKNRKTISGEYRADVRLDVLDPVIVTSKYASNIVGITDIEYSTNGGGLRGRYTGRVVSIKLEPEVFYSGERYSGEV